MYVHRFISQSMIHVRRRICASEPLVEESHLRRISGGRSAVDPPPAVGAARQNEIFLPANHFSVDGIGENHLARDPDCKADVKQERIHRRQSAPLSAEMCGPVRCHEEARVFVIVVSGEEILLPSSAGYNMQS